MAPRIVVDTNVVVSAILSPHGAAREVLRRCLTGDARPLISNALFLEYEDVLAREDLFTKAPISTRDRAVLLDAVLSVCQWVNITFLWRPNLPDESDNHLIELAVAGNAEWIITGNTRDIATGELVFDSFRIVTPGIWLKEDDEHGNTNNPNS
ncbi:MAG: putative toxin-antitoxin system toxin component, PIN family [Desulfurellaceae bacterium]|nr:putative toxin-antitoxin system toxin component, PIN family [Desulfurellaceae bacterium]